MSEKMKPTLVRLSPKQIEWLDRWAKSHEGKALSRAEAIRQIIEEAMIIDQRG